MLRQVEPERELRWALHNSPGLFSGERRFVIEPRGQDQVLLTQSEVFSGLFAPVLACVLYIGTRRAFAQMNQALKMRAEQPDAQSSAEDETVWPPPPTRLI